MRGVYQAGSGVLRAVYKGVSAAGEKWKVQDGERAGFLLPGCPTDLPAWAGPSEGL